MVTFVHKYRRKKISFIFLLLALPNIHAVGQGNLSFETRSYRSAIRTIQLSPATGDRSMPLKTAVVPIQQQNLVLEFDDLNEYKLNYYSRLVHCNYDWSPSSLRDLDFMFEYNEVEITNYEYSISNSRPYVHYRLNVPRVKLPGNYLLVVYEDGDKEKLVLSHRMMVVDPRTRLAEDGQNSGTLTLRSSNQQINFTLNYKGVQILNPMQSVHVVVRQNDRWDNARFDIKPSFIREDVQQIEYRLFGDDKFFNAGNEFRFVDFRSLNFPGQNTAKLEASGNTPHLWVQKDKSRSIDAYAQYPDINGNYIIANQDYGSADISANYVDVSFALQTSQLPESEVYVFGAFNNWKKMDENKMTYNPSTGTYESTILLKQGWYNYQYYVESKKFPPNHLEGNHFETENVYDVLVYYRAFQPNADLLIGYFTIPVNKR